jgi:type IV secretory pathway VirJ component
VWLIGVVVLVTACTPRIAEQTFDGKRLGTVRVYRPLTAPRAVAVLFSGATGWSDAWVAAARALARAGVLVAGVDLGELRRGLAAGDDGCHYLVADLEDLSKRLQRALGLVAYRSPVLAGVGDGGTLAYAALAQAPAATVAGAVSLDPAPALVTPVAFCPGAPATPAAGGGFAYGPPASLPGWWAVGVHGEPAAWLLAAVAGAGDRARLDRLADGGATPARLAKLVEAAVAARAKTAGSDALAALPLVELPTERPSRVMAVVYSGDGGWRDLDKQIGEVLARQGVPVVGVDSLRYFWQAKTPERVAADLGAIVEHYGVLWHADRVALVGYSFGAAVLPFALNRLAPTVRPRVVQLSLLGLEKHASFAIRLTEWLRAAPEDAPLVRPELARLDPAVVQCFYGTDEDDSLCPDLAGTGVELISRPGGHHFDGDYVALARTILAGIRRRSKRPRPRAGRAAQGATPTVTESDAVLPDAAFCVTLSTLTPMSPATSGWPCVWSNAHLMSIGKVRLDALAASRMRLPSSWSFCRKFGAVDEQPAMSALPLMPPLLVG